MFCFTAPVINNTVYYDSNSQPTSTLHSNANLDDNNQENTSNQSDPDRNNETLSNDQLTHSEMRDLDKRQSEIIGGSCEARIQIWQKKKLYKTKQKEETEWLFQMSTQCLKKMVFSRRRNNDEK